MFRLSTELSTLQYRLKVAESHSQARFEPKKVSLVYKDTPMLLYMLYVFIKYYKKHNIFCVTIVVGLLLETLIETLYIVIIIFGKLDRNLLAMVAIFII